MSGTLSNVYLTRNKFGLTIIPPSAKFVQCQSTIQNALKSSINQSITHLRNMQYDQYNLWLHQYDLWLHHETLLHVVAGCSSYLNRFTWRHNSILNFIANNIPLQNFQNIFADLPGFSNPSIITGDKHRPDLLLTTKDNCLYILELTLGYETHLRNNTERKQSKYAALIQDQMNNFKTVKFVNLSLSALSVFDQESSPFIEMLKRSECR